MPVQSIQSIMEATEERMSLALNTFFRPSLVNRTPPGGDLAQCPVDTYPTRPAGAWIAREVRDMATIVERGNPAGAGT
jgi:hypothetical protein